MVKRHYYVVSKGRSVIMKVKLIETMNFSELVSLLIEEGLELTKNTPTPEGMISCIELIELHSGLRIGCGVVIEYCQEIVLRYVAIKKEFQRKGYGSQIVERALEIAKEKGASRLVLTAKAPGFYEKLNFKTLAVANYPFENNCTSCKRFHHGCESEMMEYVFEQ